MCVFRMYVDIMDKAMTTLRGVKGEEIVDTQGANVCEMRQHRSRARKGRELYRLNQFEVLGRRRASSSRFSMGGKG